MSLSSRSSTLASASQAALGTGNVSASSQTSVTVDKKIKDEQRKVIIVLVRSSLETVKTKTGYELVTADTHRSLLTKMKKDPADFRPDITHQCLLTLLDSPLNKSGHLQVFIQTESNVLIEVSPHTRIPRTFKRFAGLMGL